MWFGIISITFIFYDDQSDYEKAKIEHIEEAKHITLKLPQAYPHLTQKEISLLWEETWNRGGYKYDLFCQFREPENQVFMLMLVQMVIER